MTEENRNETETGDVSQTSSDEGSPSAPKAAESGRPGIAAVIARGEEASATFPELVGSAL
ncbi:MAG: hypothetical protein O6922_06995 [Chloroflexi bacterium]|nr:hypothetical protein [Chloroflexota bacterium]